MQNICDRVAIIKEGKILKVEKISDLKNNSYKKVAFSMNGGKEVNEFSIEGATNVKIKDKEVDFIFKGDCNKLIAAISKLDLINIDISEPDLEEIFMHYYSD